MSFWGANKTQKEAQGFPREKGAWDFQQYKDWLGRANKYSDRGDSLNDWYEQYNRDRVNRGFGDPSVATNYGRQIMPGVDDAIDRRWGRLGEIEARYNQVPTGQGTADVIDRNLDKTGEAISRTQGDIQTEIDDTYGRNAGRLSLANDDILGNIGDTYGALEHNTNTAYGQMRGDNASTFGQMIDESRDAYGKARTDIERLKPGSEFQTARVARSYAPLISNTQGRLRRSGIDPNSLQATGTMLSAERERARGMDDAAAAGARDYAFASSGLTLGENEDRQRLREGRLRNEIGLHSDQVGITNRIGDARGQEFRGQIARNADAANGLDRDRSAQTIGNTDTAYGREAALYGARSDAAVARREMDRQDADVYAGLRREQNANELSDIDLRDAQFQRGLQWHTNDLTERNSAAGALGHQGNVYMQQANSAGSQARGFGEDAAQNYRQAWQYEAPNAGWGTKMILGAAPNLMDIVAPGSGTFMRAVTGQPRQDSGSSWGDSPGGGGKGYGGGWGGPSSPYVFSAQQYNTQQTRPNIMPQQSYYDPAKTKQLSNGSVQVGRY